MNMQAAQSRPALARTAAKDAIRVTTAVIVAAGKGSRLIAEGQAPKPLYPVVGVPMIARVMRAAAQAGIERFIVVVGYQAERMRACLTSLVPAGARLDVVENPRFDLPNGVSLAAAVEHLEQPFALLMSDHLFTPDRLRGALEHFSRWGTSLLVVEGRERFSGDLDDATRVVVGEGRVRAIGKHLAEYDAIDTGMFVLRPAEVRAALANAGEGPSISDAMRGLALRGELEALDHPGGAWQDVDTAEDLPRAEALLYAALTKPTDGWLARRINRRISLALSTRLWRYGLTPNLATALTLPFGLAAGAAYAQGSTLGWSLAGATLFQLQSILDGVDGELARLLHKESRTGFWFDVAADNLTHVVVFLGLARGLAVGDPAGPWPWLGWAAAGGVLASFAAMAPLLNPARGWAGTGGSEQPGLLQRLVDGLSRRDFTYALFPLALLGWLGGFLWAAAVGSWGYAATVAVVRVRARR